jgi:hypothetical protein
MIDSISNSCADDYSRGDPPAASHFSNLSAPASPARGCQTYFDTMHIDDNGRA